MRWIIIFIIISKNMFLHIIYLINRLWLHVKCSLSVIQILTYSRPPPHPGYAITQLTIEMITWEEEIVRYARDIHQLVDAFPLVKKN